jgi:hypothetical protein
MRWPKWIDTLVTNMHIPIVLLATLAGAIGGSFTFGIAGAIGGLIIGGILSLLIVGVLLTLQQRILPPDLQTISFEITKLPDGTFRKVRRLKLNTAELPDVLYLSEAGVLEGEIRPVDSAHINCRQQIIGDDYFHFEIRPVGRVYDLILRTKSNGRAKLLYGMKKLD